MTVVSVIIKKKEKELPGARELPSVPQISPNCPCSLQKSFFLQINKHEIQGFPLERQNQSFHS
jgi:hypothetical protein